MLRPPPNSRVFIGNIASERVTKEELHSTFSKYGPIVGEVLIHRNYGFVQYDNPDSARAAIAGESGRLLGGLRIGVYSCPFNFL
jgi:RNA recognition motif-containing protein